MLKDVPCGLGLLRLKEQKREIAVALSKVTLFETLDFGVTSRLELKLHVDWL